MFKYICWANSQILLWWNRLVSKDWKVWIKNRLCLKKVSVFGVILVCIFPAFSRIWSEYGEIHSAGLGYLEKCNPRYSMFVSADINPADITTRLLPPNGFVSCKLWWKGLNFFTLKIFLMYLSVPSFITLFSFCNLYLHHHLFFF